MPRKPTHERPSSSQGTAVSSGLTPVVQQPTPSASSSEKHACHAHVEQLIRTIDGLQAPIRWESLQYEIGAYLVHVAHLFAQNFNVYRFNFHNYNCSLILLSLLVLAKGIAAELYSSLIVGRIGKAPSWLEANALLAAATLIGADVAYLLVQLLRRHSVYDCIFLFYPVMLVLLSRTPKPTNPLQRVGHELRQLLFDSMEHAYISAFLPLRLLKHNYLYFDSLSCYILLGYAFVGSVIMRVAKLFATRFDTLQLETHALGQWAFVPPNDIDHHHSNSAEPWSSQKVYAKGALVTRHGKLYLSQACGPNSTEPGTRISKLVSVVFARVAPIHNMLLVIQTIVIASQLVLMLHSVNWSCYVLLLLINYLVLAVCIHVRRINMMNNCSPSSVSGVSS